MTALRSHHFDSAAEAVLSAACDEHEVELIIDQRTDGRWSGSIVTGERQTFRSATSFAAPDRETVASDLLFALRGWFPSDCETCLGSGTCASDDFEADGVATCGCRA